MATVSNYSEQDIQYLEGVEHVRRRPGMYVGGTDIRALHHLVYEIVDNSVDEAMAGRGNQIDIILHEDASVSVNDNGDGIPVGPYPKDPSISTLELVMTKLGAGGKFDSDAYKVSGGLHGVGSSAVNALSEWMQVEVRRNGKLWVQKYECGHPVTKVYEERDLLPGESTGTRTIFKPDPTIMQETYFNYNTLLQRFREMAFVVRGLMIKLRDERTTPPQEHSFYFEGGLRSFIRYINRHKQPVHDVIYGEREVKVNSGKEEFRVGVEFAMQYTHSTNSTELTFANTINTGDGGTHQTGLRTAITRTVNDTARKLGLLKERDENFSGDDTREGLTSIVSVKHPDPQFESQTKVKLMNPEVTNAVAQVVTDTLSQFMELNISEAKRIVEKSIEAQRIREALRKQRDVLRSSSLLESTTLPGKLADCTSRDPKRSELFIVEGDSAGGSAKQGRDRDFQAILPLRGKILNTERTRLNRALDNNEIRALISALGVGIGDQFNLESLRYGRVIIMTDADVDGAHISTLLLTFFFRYMTPLIESGHLYIAQPPLYRIARGRNENYVYSEDEKDNLLVEMGGEDRVTMQMYKGLGEMNPDQLWETTMNPENRILLQVSVDNMTEADRTFSMLMGSEVPPRRHFIQTHAKSVRNLDTIG